MVSSSQPSRSQQGQTRQLRRSPGRRLLARARSTTGDSAGPTAAGSQQPDAVRDRPADCSPNVHRSLSRLVPIRPGVGLAAVDGRRANRCRTAVRWAAAGWAAFRRRRSGRPSDGQRSIARCANRLPNIVDYDRKHSVQRWIQRAGVRLPSRSTPQCTHPVPRRSIPKQSGRPGIELGGLDCSPVSTRRLPARSHRTFPS
jgi:hypothetical protein